NQSRRSCTPSESAQAMRTSLRLRRPALDARRFSRSVIPELHVDRNDAPRRPRKAGERKCKEAHARTGLKDNHSPVRKVPNYCEGSDPSGVPDRPASTPATRGIRDETLLTRRKVRRHLPTRTSGSSQAKLVDFVG